jgi:hypothetical protein
LGGGAGLGWDSGPRLATTIARAKATAASRVAAL